METDISGCVVQGHNCLRIDVENTHSVAMGLDIGGYITGTTLALEKPGCCNPSGSIIGTMFRDIDCNGQRSPNEPGLPGWTIALNNGTKAVTDALGNYYFYNLWPGTYRVSEVPMDGWEQSSPGGDGTYTIVLGTNQVIQRDFLNREIGKCADLWMQDSKADSGDEPDAQAEPILWASEDIWVRNTNDASTTHQNPISGEINYVYVNARNRGTDTGYATLHVYWAKASSNLYWPRDWTNSNGPVCDTIGSGELVPMDIMVPPNSVRTVGPFLWIPPDPQAFRSCFTSQEAHHFCLLARLETAHDKPYGMSNPETENVGWNTRYNKRIIWKNVSVVFRYGSGAPPTAVLLRGNPNHACTAVLRLTSIPASPRTSFFTYGSIGLHLNDALYSHWVQAHRPGRVDGSDDSTRTIRLAHEDAWVGGLDLDAREVAPITVAFNFIRKPPTDSSKFVVDLAQYGAGNDSSSADGGERFDIQYHHPADADSVFSSDGAGIALQQNVPNPANRETTIGFALATPNAVHLVLCDMSGREMRTLADGRYEAGEHSIICTLNDLPAGTYLYKLIVNNVVRSRTLIVVH
ncbi:MAG: T9SS type A sorting domain-containing protein [Bacteroidetes bacterium]|nr:T9SS type A sorting domain-containing protein [Bacteroidota bacterium]